MFCRNCGMELNMGERFCSRCGTPVAEPEIGAAEAESKAEIKSEQPKPEEERKAVVEAPEQPKAVRKREPAVAEKKPAPVAPARAGKIGAGYRFLILLLSVLIAAGTGASFWFLGGVEWLREVLLLAEL